MLVPRAYSWIWAQGALLAGSRTYGVLEINPESAMCKAYALPISLVQIFILFYAIAIGVWGLLPVQKLLLAQCLGIIHPVGTQATIQWQELNLDLCMQSILALY